MWAPEWHWFSLKKNYQHLTMRVMMIMCLIRVILLVKNKVIMMGYLLYMNLERFFANHGIIFVHAVYIVNK